MEEDVIIIGGGPAGAAMGCYLSQAGVNNLIIEKANHPREHIGESLVTNTTRIFQELGFLDTMEQAGFVHKYGATWHAPSSGEKFSIVFAEFPLEGVSQPYSYHVDRAKFDLLLLKHAEKLGSKVCQGATVTQVLFDAQGKACGVRIKVGGQSLDLPCKIVVDASGRDTFLGRHLRLKEKDPLFNQYAIHTWFENVDRGAPEKADDIHIYFLEIEKGWVWQIPISKTVSSIGVVTEKKDFLSSGMDMDAFFNTHARSNPNLARALQNARRLKDYKAEGDYSYSLSRFVGDGFVVIGDAARFVDPIFSSGISVALHSAKFASETIVKALAAGDCSEAAFAPYEEKLRAGVAIWYEFIRLYYRLLPLFTYFIQNPKYRLQVHRLLQGEVFERDEVPVLEAMRQYIVAVESSDKSLLRNRLLAVPID